MLHVEEGHDADGVPQVDGSTDVEVLLMSAGMLFLYIAQESSMSGRKLVEKPQRTVQNQTLNAIPVRRHITQYDDRTIRTHKMPEMSNCAAHTPPPADAKAAPALLGCDSMTVQPMEEFVP